MPTYESIFISELNDLADAINTKAGTSGKKTLTQLTTTVQGIQTAKPEMSKRAYLDLSEGWQMIVPDQGKVLSSVTIWKPDTLIPENVKKDITIAGITGSFEGASLPPKAPGYYYYDGQKLDSKHVKFYSSGEQIIPPSYPQNNRLFSASVDNTYCLLYDLGFDLPALGSEESFTSGVHTYTITCIGSEDSGSEDDS